jgi:1,2-phenylacetyl-CoA epoxidase catalytic subunit
MHPLTTPDTDSEKYYRARYHYLLQIIFGETIAIDYCKTMATFAPNKEASDYLLQQQKEEELHLDMLTEYVGVHPRPHVLISPALKKLDDIMSQAITKRDYIECIFIQNFIVEGLNISLLREFEHHTDGNLSELSTKILRDEIGHMEFGITEMKRILQEDRSKKLRKKLISLQRKTLFYATGLALTLAREAKYLGIPMHEFAEKAVNEHFDRIKEAGLPLPLLDKILFNGARLFLKIL